MDISTPRNYLVVDLLRGKEGWKQSNLSKELFISPEHYCIPPNDVMFMKKIYTSIGVRVSPIGWVNVFEISGDDPLLFRQLFVGFVNDDTAMEVILESWEDLIKK